MVKIIFFLLLFVELLFADFIGIESENYFVKNRIVYVNNFLQKTHSVDEINEFFNEFQYKKDVDNYNKSEYWASPEEFIIKGGGDCEDYAIIKGMATLYSKQCELDNMFIGITKKDGVSHAVLVIFNKNNDSVLIMDNMINKVYISSKNEYKLIPFSMVIQKLKIV